MDRREKLYEVIRDVINGSRHVWSSHEQEHNGIYHALNKLEGIIDEDKPKKTSDKWYEELYVKPSKHFMIIYDPDGWDRTNYHYSFYEEEITRDEFENRVAASTCMWNPIK